MPNGTSTAVTEATRLGEIGFPEFTAKLVKDVFDALLGATLRQMEAYSQLVAATAKTLQEYVSENKNLVSGEEVWDWLTTNLPGPAKDVAANPGRNPPVEHASLLDGELNEGEHSVVFDARDLSSGVYFYRMQARTFVQQRKMVVVK
jgi:hypothetical protein